MSYDGPIHLARREAAKTRALMFAAQYLAGKTLQEIGNANGFTREYIRQCITKHYGRLAKVGGQSVSARANEKARKETLDNISFKNRGCSQDDYLKLRAMRSPTRAYTHQRKNAHTRGIEWQFTLWEWWTVWRDSGHWHERGRSANSYVMCRYGDAGPYSKDNCYIATAGDNVRHYQERRHGNLTEYSTARAA